MLGQRPLAKVAGLFVDLLLRTRRYVPLASRLLSRGPPTHQHAARAPPPSAAYLLTVFLAPFRADRVSSAKTILHLASAPADALRAERA